MHSRFTPLRVFSLSSPLSLHGIRARRRIETLIMVDSSSLPKVTKSEENKAIAIPHSTAPHLVGFHVPIKLTRENFPLWKTQLFPLLNYHDPAHILMQDLPISTQIADHDGITVNAAYQTWWHQDQQVLSLIVTSLSKSVLPYVVRKLTAKEAWSALMKHCSSTNPSRIMHLHNRLHNTQKGTRSIAKFVQDIQRTCDELAAAANSVQESVSTYALLHGLGSAYSTFSTGISSNLINLGFDDVVAQINSYEDLMKFSHPAKDITVSDFPPKANQTQITSSSRGRGCNNGRNNHGRGRNGGRYIPRFQLCGQFGHRILECRERFNKSFYGQQNSPPNHTNQDFPQAYNTNMQLPQVYTTNLQPVHTPQDHSVWYPDSGATHHVTNNAHNLINPKIYQGPDQLHVGNDIGLVIHSTGSSSLISRSLPIKLVNILHVPDIQKNLLSVFRLTNDNFVFVEFHATYCIVTDEITGRPLHRGTVKDGLYLLAQARPPEVNIGERIGVDLWHHHLGHPKMRLLQSVISTYGLSMLSVSKTLSCDACLSSKSHHLPYSKSTHQTSRALKIIHSDLWGPSPIISHLGNWYYVLFIDDFTRYTWQLVPRPLHHPVIGCKWVYKTKPSLAGAPLRYKARLISKGFHQEGGIDYHETFSPIIKTTTIRLLLALAISKQWHICQLDISNAFLHGNLTELIYMEQPPGFHHPHYPHHVCQLRNPSMASNKPPESGFANSPGDLNLGFHGSKTDPSLYFLTTRPLYILIYVDNILILGPSLSPIHQLITSLKTHFRRKDLGPASRFLSIELHKH